MSRYSFTVSKSVSFELDRKPGESDDTFQDRAANYAEDLLEDSEPVITDCSDPDLIE